MESRMTPLLTVDETKPMNERVKEGVVFFFILLILWAVYSFLVNQGQFVFTFAWIAALILAPLLYFFLGGRNRFVLYEEGVKIKRRFGREYLDHWESFRSYTADPLKKQLILKKKSIGAIQLRSADKFDEVKRIVSEHIASSQ